MNNNKVRYQDLKGKTILITGANRGIGKSIAENFMANQCRVIALFRSTPPKFDKSILKTSIEPEYLHSDIQNIEKMKSWLNSIERKGQSIDILVNNAAVYKDQKLMDTNEESWDRIMDINLKSTFFLSQLVAKHMKNNGGGVIVNAASFAVNIASLNFAVYAASKAALVSLTQTMAAEYAPHNIRVNAFSPGVIKTNMTNSSIEKNSQKLLAAISLNRFGEVEEVAKVVLFLASEQSSYITGINLDISGGKLIVQNPSLAWNK